MVNNSFSKGTLSIWAVFACLPTLAANIELLGASARSCYFAVYSLQGSVDLRKFLPPLLLFLVGIGFWLSSRPSTDFSAGREAPGVSGMENTDSAKKREDIKDSVATRMPDDSFPVKYLATWKTDEGLMALTKAPGSQFLKGFYYDDSGNVKGKIKATYIKKGAKKRLSGYWVQSNSLKKCDFEKYGSYYWGRLVFQFEDDRFIGIWGYCDDKADGTWNGNLV